MNKEGRKTKNEFCFGEMKKKKKKDQWKTWKENIE